MSILVAGVPTARESPLVAESLIDASLLPSHRGPASLDPAVPCIAKRQPKRDARKKEAS